MRSASIWMSVNKSLGQRKARAVDLVKNPRSHIVPAPRVDFNSLRLNWTWRQRHERGINVNTFFAFHPTRAADCAVALFLLVPWRQRREKTVKRKQRATLLAITWAWNEKSNKNKKAWNILFPRWAPYDGSRATATITRICFYAQHLIRDRKNL